MLGSCVRRGRTPLHEQYIGITMDNRFMEKTTFSEICKMMKNGGEKDRRLINNVFDLGLVFLPALISSEI